MVKLYKICFLGYKKLTEMAEKVLSEELFSDTDIRLVDCTTDNLAQEVDKAMLAGYEVFVAGAGNAAEFTRHSYAHLSEIRLRTVDYLIAIKKGLAIGNKIAIAVYRYSRPVDVDLLSELSGVDIKYISYEDSSELYQEIKNSGCDIIIGASHANELSQCLGKKSILLYPGEASVRDAIRRAHTLAIELRKAQETNEIFQSVVNNSPFGIIVTDSEKRILLFNKAAYSITGLDGKNVMRQTLSELLPSLSTDELKKTSNNQMSQKHLINGAMIKCTQQKLTHYNELTGFLITLYADNTRTKREIIEAADFTAKYRWSDKIGDSTAIKNAINQAKQLEELDSPVVICGEDGTGRSFFSQCMHNASKRANQPYITVNAATLPSQEAYALLFGKESFGSVSRGLFETVECGTIVFSQMHLACSAVQNCILQVISEQQFIRLGGHEPITFKGRLVALAPPDFMTNNQISAGLLYRLSAFSINLPPLRERNQDSMWMFSAFLIREDSALSLTSVDDNLRNIVLSYSWPGNIVEISSVCKRFSLSLRKSVRLRSSAKPLLLIQAIGEEKLFEDIVSKYPALSDIANSDPAKVAEGIKHIKQIMKYNNSKIAERFNLGRTTLWRITKKHN